MPKISGYFSCSLQILLVFQKYFVLLPQQIQKKLSDIYNETYPASYNN